ncbi:CD48 antigen-like [Phyllobates terribilis]|uniref:CD48 antigen-like n=1 Tax=Phyllobates terribilis TaxID=111132 RepID=UPI003CCAECBB
MQHITQILLSVMVPVFLLVHSSEPVSVIGLVNRSVELSAYRHFPLPVKETIWKFTSGGSTVKVTEAGNNSFLTYSDQFKNRIEASNNGTIITIRHLSLKDTGKYCAEIVLTSKVIHKSIFTLTVYDPIPTPAIKTEWMEYGGDRCNVTFHCSAPSHTSALFYTWKYTYQDKEYKLYSNGSTIQISLLPGHKSMEFLCIVQSPADQKNVSVHLEWLCGLANMMKNKGCYLYLRSGLIAAFLLISLFSIYLSRCYQ